MINTTPIITTSVVPGLSFTALRNNVRSFLRELYININTQITLSQGVLWCCREIRQSTYDSIALPCAKQTLKIGLKNARPLGARELQGAGCWLNWNGTTLSE